MDFSEPALLRERRVFEIVWFDAEVRGDVVADHFEPFELFFCETFVLTPALSRRERGLAGALSWGERGCKYCEVADHFFFPGFFGVPSFLRGGLAGSFFTASSKSLSTRDLCPSWPARYFSNSSSAFCNASSWEILPACWRISRSLRRRYSSSFAIQSCMVMGLRFNA